MKRGLAVLLACASSAFAQTKEGETPQAPARSERPALNLKLDNPASFANMQPDTKAEASSLPTLGGDALQVPKEKPLQPQSPASPYPVDTAPGAN